MNKVVTLLLLICSRTLSFALFMGVFGLPIKTGNLSTFVVVK